MVCNTLQGEQVNRGLGFHDMVDFKSVPFFFFFQIHFHSMDMPPWKWQKEKVVGNLLGAKKEMWEKRSHPWSNQYH